VVAEGRANIADELARRSLALEEREEALVMREAEVRKREWWPSKEIGSLMSGTESQTSVSD
jgi:hypothetical protein